MEKPHKDNWEEQKNLLNPTALLQEAHNDARGRAHKHVAAFMHVIWQPPSFALCASVDLNASEALQNNPALPTKSLQFPLYCDSVLGK